MINPSEVSIHGEGILGRKVDGKCIDWENLETGYYGIYTKIYENCFRMFFYHRFRFNSDIMESIHL